MVATSETARLATAVDAMSAKADRIVDTLSAVDRSQALTQQRLDLLVPVVDQLVRDVGILRSMVERGRGAQWAVTVGVGLVGLALVVMQLLERLG